MSEDAINSRAGLLEAGRAQHGPEVLSLLWGEHTPHKAKGTTHLESTLQRGIWHRRKALGISENTLKNASCSPVGQMEQLSLILQTEGFPPFHLACRGDISCELFPSFFGMLRASMELLGTAQCVPHCIFPHSFCWKLFRAFTGFKSVIQIIKIILI